MYNTFQYNISLSHTLSLSFLSLFSHTLSLETSLLLQIAFLVSAAALFLSSSAFLLHLLFSFPSVKTRLSLLFRGHLMKEKFFIFLHHFLCFYYSLSLLLSSLSPSLSLPVDQRDLPFHSHTSLTPNTVIFDTLLLLLLTLWSSVYYEYGCHLSDPGKVESRDLSRDECDDRYCHSCQQVKVREGEIRGGMKYPKK